MEATARSSWRAIRARFAGHVRVDPAAIAAWALPVLLIVYLALNDGGYGPIERSEAGIAIWWLVLVGTAVGALPAAGGSRAGRIFLVVLALFAAYTALSLAWTESAERTATEVSRVAVFLGVFALALAVQGEGRWRHLLAGVTTGIALVCGLALLSRLEPALFPERISGSFLAPAIERRLAYPLNYSTALGVLAAIGIPLALSASAGARTLLARGLAAAALPALALVLWMTSSGLAHAAAAIGLVTFFVLAPDRLPKFVTALVAGAGSAVLFGALADRPALDRGLTGGAALQQGDEMLAVVLVVCAGVGLVQVGLGIALRYGGRPAWLRVTRGRALVAAAGAAACLLVAGVAAGVPGELGDAVDRVGTREGSLTLTESRSSEILDLSSSGRNEFWGAAVDANATAPLVGTGPGTFEYWWAREGSYEIFIRDAHSLFMEMLAELGIAGLALVAFFTLGALAFGAVRLWSAPPDLRLAIAAAVAGGAVFLVGAAVDWGWEMGTLAVTFMLLAAIAVGAGGDAPVPGRVRSFASSAGGRVAIVALSVAALVAIALPMTSAEKVDESRAAAQAGDLHAALDRARDAVAAEPYAATPRLQEALLLERAGDFAAAREAALAATDKEPTNWRTWLVLSRLEARSGHSAAAVDAYRRVAELNPRSDLLAQLSGREG